MPDTHTCSVELLAPAGAPESLIAAINNGADAVYLGLSDLNARRGAANFDLETLAAATQFAHLRGGRIYLTANVVVLPHEMASALEMIDAAWAAGIDAVIVQDLGLLRVVRDALPHVRVHASTQIDTHNPDGIGVLASLGVTRVTLARELSLAAIAACADAGMEVETFVHGALCYCYSGQCLLSSLIGRRSANRGMCAQPCRLTYDLIDADGSPAEVPGRYLLSPRDLAGIEHLPALVAAGVTALKIEGRMKSPEYVAIVTGVYRAALDRAVADPDRYEVLPAEWEMLEEAFSRGFTDGYLTGKRAGDLMSYTRPNNRGVRLGRVVKTSGTKTTIELERALDPADTLEVWTRAGRFAQAAGPLTVDGTPVRVAPAGSAVDIAMSQSVAVGDRVFRVANDALLQAARRTFRGGTTDDHRPASVDFAVRVRAGQPLSLTARCGDISVEVSGDAVQAARTKPISADEVVEHVGRLGGSGYRAGSWSIDLDAAAGLGFSALHALRREALQRLDEMRLAPWADRALHHPSVPTLPARGAHRRATPEIVACAWDLETASACLEAGADRALLRVFGEAEVIDLPDGVSPLLPRIAWPDEVAGYDSWLARAAGITVGNLGLLGRAAESSGGFANRAAGTRIEADWPLNVLNPHAAAAVAEVGASLVWASPELSGRQLAELAAGSPVDVGALIWGRLEMMVAEQCVLQASGPCGRRCAGCARRAGWWRLRDEKGYEFPVTTDVTGRSHILNSVTLDLTRALPEVVAAGVSAVRIDFSDEGAARAATIVREVRSALTAVVGGASAPEEPLISPSTSGHFFRGVL